MIERKDIDKLLNFKNVVRPKSLVITVMGDVLTMHGKQVWSGNLVKICEWFNISEHSSRVSLQRLLNEGWIIKKKKNFYIYYEFSSKANEIFNLKKEVIYSKISDDWKQSWQLMILRKDGDSTDKLIKEINWLGFRKIYKNIYLFPGNTRGYMEGLVKQYGLKEHVVFMEGGLSDLENSKVIEQMANELWDVNNMARVFKDFIDRMSRIDAKLIQKICLVPDVSLYTRLKLVHEYTHIILRYNNITPKLHKQGDLLDEMYTKLGKLYFQLSESSLVYIYKNMRNSSGDLPKVDKLFYQRFAPSAKGLKNSSNEFYSLSSLKLRPFLK